MRDFMQDVKIYENFKGLLKSRSKLCVPAVMVVSWLYHVQMQAAHGPSQYLFSKTSREGDLCQTESNTPALEQTYCHGGKYLLQQSLAVQL